MSLKSGGAEWEFETYLVKFETYSVVRDYETKKTAGAPEPPEPPSLAPMHICESFTTSGQVNHHKKICPNLIKGHFSQKCYFFLKYLYS